MDLILTKLPPKTINRPLTPEIGVTRVLTTLQMTIISTLLEKEEAAQPPETVKTIQLWLLVAIQAKWWARCQPLITLITSVQPTTRNKTKELLETPQSFQIWNSTTLKWISIRVKVKGSQWATPRWSKVKNTQLPERRVTIQLTWDPVSRQIWLNNLPISLVIARSMFQELILNRQQVSNRTKWTRSNLQTTIQWTSTFLSYTNNMLKSHLFKLIMDPKCNNIRATQGRMPQLTKANTAQFR